MSPGHAGLPKDFETPGFLFSRTHWRILPASCLHLLHAYPLLLACCSCLFPAIFPFPATPLWLHYASFYYPLLASFLVAFPASFHVAVPANCQFPPNLTRLHLASFPCHHIWGIRLEEYLPENIR